MKKGYLDDIDMSEDKPTFDKPSTSEAWKNILADFSMAAKNDEPKHVVQAYTRSQPLSRKINNDMARNTYHELTLYCTPLNCNVLARTQDGIDAFVSLLFHPKLDQYVCKDKLEVYRGSVIKSEGVLKSYEKSSIIISTTFLSTSRNPTIAEIYNDPGNTNKISCLCTYKKIFNYRRTALNIQQFSQHPEEKEVLILPYVPFKITSFDPMVLADSGKQRIEVKLEEIGDDNLDMQSAQTVSTLV
ncbi:unnamed protein product [Didymodactylos carnosus]|uniref:NAD(P)(+)--arginine ADP-ribosyltransferase n=1 Tax=Didymodactylos carnosus TaxID=1234261 RepID=A0A816BL09_9BILA|nr:unnamed protein product [Didymodactylos carnosus]CAF1609061.1 unnamed protein product [Didymodactylos carnosus]CAF4168881.1 unnamed protein product [Didymodactylos carnosus]CAF4491024.1 unnamed protein product [Didymodactylos carnosus]